MRALTLAAGGTVALSECPDPRIESPTDAIVRVEAAGICGSDLHIIGGKVPEVPLGTILGHEFLGSVVDVGSAVSSVGVGDRCIAAMFVACGSCTACLEHRWRNCPAYAVYGHGRTLGSLQGGQAEYVLVRNADLTLETIPDGVSDDDAIVMSDILPTAFTAAEQSGLSAGMTVAVVGAGPVGQLLVMCSLLFGASRVYAIDPILSRRAAAAAAGAVGLAPEEADAVVDEVGGADVVFEAVGSGAALATAWHVATRGATVALVGVLIDEPWPTSIGESWLKWLRVVPIFGDAIGPRAKLLSLIREKRIAPGTVVTEHRALDEGPDAYRDFTTRATGKVVLVP